MTAASQSAMKLLRYDGWSASPTAGARSPASLKTRARSRATKEANMMAARQSAMKLRNRSSRRLLVTTNSELSAIAAAAIIGLRKPTAASGMATTL
jgi:hypothetical protein